MQACARRAQASLVDDIHSWSTQRCMSTSSTSCVKADRCRLASVETLLATYTGGGPQDTLQTIVIGYMTDVSATGLKSRSNSTIEDSDSMQRDALHIRDRAVVKPHSITMVL